MEKRYTRVKGSESRYKDYIGFSKQGISPKEILVVSDRRKESVSFKDKESLLYPVRNHWVDFEAGRVAYPLINTRQDLINVALDFMLITGVEVGTGKFRLPLPQEDESVTAKRVKVTWTNEKLKGVYAHFGEYHNQLTFLYLPILFGNCS